MKNGHVSFWQHQAGEQHLLPPLPGDTEVDVAIIGGGFTGLWTAYYLRKADPSLRIAIAERRFCGFGASGRNGGWVTGALAGTRAGYARTHGQDGVRQLQAAMIATVDEVIRVTAAEGIEADLAKHGVLSVALSAPQLERLTAAHRADLDWGPDDHELLDAEQTAARINVAGALGGRWWPHCARANPAKLVRGLRQVVTDLGVGVFEQTPALGFDGHSVATPHGTIRAQAVVRATEGFTAQLPGLRRSWLPMNSCMIVTAPLSESVWKEIGWQQPMLLGDNAHAYMYAQRTSDDRIALGGRGVPYRFGSRTDNDGWVQESAVRSLTAILHAYFPATRRTAIEHAWSGVLGVPRDWCATVGYDPLSGMGWAGGYTGHGVATTNLAGRTLADLITGKETPLTSLPWVGRTVRPWEPEPLRWLGVRAMYAAYRSADRAERHRTTISPLARLADTITGHTH